MTKNVGNFDRILRLAVGIALAVLAWTAALQGPIAVAAWLVAAVLVLTSIFGVCPAYRLIGMNTCSKP